MGKLNALLKLMKKSTDISDLKKARQRSMDKFKELDTKHPFQNEVFPGGPYPQFRELEKAEDIQRLINNQERHKLSPEAIQQERRMIDQYTRGGTDYTSPAGRDVFSSEEAASVYQGLPAEEKNILSQMTDENAMDEIYKKYFNYLPDLRREPKLPVNDIPPLDIMDLNEALKNNIKSNLSQDPESFQKLQELMKRHKK